MRIGIIRTRWNNEDVSNLVSGVREGLAKCKVNEKSIFETSVPGSFELPLAARYLALSGTVDAIVCVGVLIKGDTMHFEFIADAVAKGLIIVASVCPIFCTETPSAAARSLFTLTTSWG